MLRQLSFSEIGDSITQIIWRNNNKRKLTDLWSQILSCWGDWERADNVALQWPSLPVGGSVVKACFHSLPCCPLKPTVAAVCWCCICLLCCVNITFSSTSARCSLFAQITWIFPASSYVSVGALDGALKHARLLCLTNGDCVNSSSHCPLLNFIQREWEVLIFVRL